MTSTAPVPATAGESTSPAVAGLDVASRNDLDADRLVHALVRTLRQDPGGREHVDGWTFSTHTVRPGGAAHVAVSVDLAGPAGPPADLPAATRALLDAVARVQAVDGGPWAAVLPGLAAGPDDLRAGAAEAVAEHAARRGGRAVHFPGVAGLTGTLPVGEVLRRSAVERVVLHAAGDADPDALLVTRGHVRPRRHEGRLVLHVQPARGGTFVPFESPAPTPCCADHD